MLIKICTDCVYRKDCKKLKAELFKKENLGREVRTVLCRIAENCGDYIKEVD